MKYKNQVSEEAAHYLIGACQEALDTLQWIRDTTPGTDLRSAIIRLEHALKLAGVNI